MQHMLSILMSIISTEKERSPTTFQRRTSFCSNEQAISALNLTQLGSTEDLSIFAPLLKSRCERGYQNNKIQEGAPE